MDDSPVKLFESHPGPRIAAPGRTRKAVQIAFSPWSVLPPVPEHAFNFQNTSFKERSWKPVQSM